jgi:hypothetical protein
MMKSDKKGQVTLFILLAVLVVATIVLLFYYLKPDIFSQNTKQPRFDSCIYDSIEKNIKFLALNGGIINPQFNYKYLGNNYTYLCYTNEYHKPCVNQQPLLINVFEDSLKVLLKDNFQKCYDSSLNDLIKRGYSVSPGIISSNISINPEGVVIELDTPMIISSGSSAVSTQKYKYIHPTNLYELLTIATSIVQFETYYGDSEQTMQMFYYPNIIIDKQRRDEDNKVYTLLEKNENIGYRFAIKSYPWPAGGSYQ